MVRLINQDNVKTVASLAFSILKIQEKMTNIAEFNNPNLSPCIYAMWHSDQFCVHGLPNRANVNVLISNSLDGQIVAEVCEKWGFQTCRGSSKRKGSVSATLKMIEKLKNNQDIAIMVDGPRGPLHKVKPGAVVLARETKVPIVPVFWYSPDITFAKFPSWDKMRCPIGPCKILNLYGKPIYVDETNTDKQIAKKIQKSLLHLEEIAPEKYKKAKELKLWNKK